MTMPTRNVVDGDSADAPPKPTGPDRRNVDGRRPEEAELEASGRGPGHDLPRVALQNTYGRSYGV